MIENISTIVIAFAALVTAGATIVLAVITKRYVILTQDILKATNKPKVILFLRYSHPSISLCVQNIGTGYAADIEFSGDLSFKTIDRYGREDKTLKDIEPFKSGINFFGTGHKIGTYLCGDGDIQDLKKRSFKILISYKDSANKTFKDYYDFDLGNWENTSQFITPYTDDVANAIERVAEKINRLILNNSGRDRMNRRVEQHIKIPDTKLLERIAQALEKMSSDK